MPSVVAGVTPELNEFLDGLVEKGRFNSRSDAARHLMEYGATRKYDVDVGDYEEDE